MRKDRLFCECAALFLIAALLVSSGCSKKEPTEAVPVAAYVGSQLCENCHESIVTSFLTTGHPYKLNKMSNGILPTYP
ncbi:MAG: hypothetical protein ACE5JA_04305, partial [bacterium]